MEKDLIYEINNVRSNPASYAEKLERYKSYFQGNVWKDPNSNVGIKTEEGAAAVDEAINFLRSKAQRVDSLTPSKGLNKVAADFLREFQKDANANVELDPVISRYGNFTGNLRRLVQFGSNTAEHVVINLLVCDGDKSRGHRDAILADGLKKVGVAYGPQDTYKCCSVIVVCSKFDNTVDGDDSVY